MPIYEYRCENGHSFEVIRTMSEGPVSSCVECGGAVEQVFHPIAVHFKGSGFYTTDYAKKGAAKGGEGDKDGGGKGESKGDSKGSGSESKSSKETKSSGSDKTGKGSGGGD
jgi:putative FmdB family regulatory protein